MKRHLIPVALALAAAMLVPLASHAQGLDGREFHGVFLERGKTSGDEDTLIFRNGRFRSTACDRYGYSDAAYKIVPVADGVRFEAETVSAKYGKLQWTGFVRGGKLDATVLMVRDGRKPVENWVVAAERN
jgi:hypothetical protein